MIKEQKHGLVTVTFYIFHPSHKKIRRPQLIIKDGRYFFNQTYLFDRVVHPGEPFQPVLKLLEKGYGGQFKEGIVVAETGLSVPTREVIKRRRSDGATVSKRVALDIGDIAMPFIVSTTGHTGDGMAAYGEQAVAILRRHVQTLAVANRNSLLAIVEPEMFWLIMRTLYGKAPADLPSSRKKIMVNFSGTGAVLG